VTNPDAEIDPALLLNCEAQLLIGSMNASEKGSSWNGLKQSTRKILSHPVSKRALPLEGVDGPALGMAVLF